MKHKPPRSQRYDVPWKLLDLAQRRTEFIFAHVTYGDIPLRRALACAYAQGLADAGEANDSSSAERQEAIHS